MDSERVKKIVKINGNGLELYNALNNLLEATRLMLLNVEQPIDKKTGEEFNYIRDLRIRMNEAHHLLQDLNKNSV